MRNIFIYFALVLTTTTYFIIIEGDLQQALSLLLIGIAASFIGTLAGGAGLITLPAMLLLGIPIHTSIATNKFSTGISSFIATLTMIARKQLRIQNIWRYILISFFGGLIGASLTTFVTEKMMNITAIFLLIFALIITLTNKNLLTNEETQDISKVKSPFLLFFIAIYDGGFGPGSAAFNITNFLKQKISYVESAKLTRTVNFGSCAGAFILFYATGFVNWMYAIPIATGSIIGSQIGIQLLPRVPKKTVRVLLPIIFSLLILQVSLKMFS